MLTAIDSEWLNKGKINFCLFQSLIAKVNEEYTEIDKINDMYNIFDRQNKGYITPENFEMVICR
jgi:Ca2+-binding EF-hand superfamily protein